MDQRPKIRPGTLNRAYGNNQAEVEEWISYSVEQEYAKVCALIDRDAKRVASEGYPSMILWNRPWDGNPENLAFRTASEILVLLQKAGFNVVYHHGGKPSRKTIGVKLLWQKA